MTSRGSQNKASRLAQVCGTKRPIVDRLEKPLAGGLELVIGNLADARKIDGAGESRPANHRRCWRQLSANPDQPIASEGIE